ncbi:MAG: TrkA C-terminal domain-containing protein, partial [Bacteroidales bacterium]|nr:TrkA C-terminal domain-containing protein [Candidatus Sodaliphilus fimicaballi]
MLPARVVKALGGYSKTARIAEVPESREIWNSVGKRYLLRLVLYSVVTLGIIFVSGKYLWPIIDNAVDEFWDEFVWSLITFVCVSPFLFGLLMPRIKASELNRLVELKGKISFVPLVVMYLVSTLLTIFYLMIILQGVYPSEIAFVVSIVFALVVIFLLTPVLKKRIVKLEQRFIGNANERENRRTGRNNNLVHDVHLAYMTVGYDCPFVGEKLRDADLRRKYGINVVNIERNGVLHPVPTGDMRVFPGDTLGVIGTEEQIERMLPIVEQEDSAATAHNEARFASYVLTKKSPLVGKTLKEARLREDYGALLVAVERVNSKHESQFISPTPEVEFGAGDIIWVVGDSKVLRKIV